MSGDVLTTGPTGPTGPTPAGPAGRGPREDGGGPWTLTSTGVATVMRLELRQRIRATRWVVVLVVWTLLIGGLTGLLWLALGPLSDNPAGDDDTGSVMFGIIVFLVLTLGSLVAPALSATSINGDRNAGVLATLQTTLLSPAEIAVGKLLAAWATALALLVTSAPFILVAYLVGGTPASRLIVVVVLLALMLLVVCAIALGWSAICARTSSSSVLTYLTVAFFGIGLPLLFALSLPFTSTTEDVTVRMPDYSATGDVTACVTRVERQDVTHTELTWWILAASPYVVVADAAPTPSDGRSADDPLSGIREGVRELRLGQDERHDYCRGGLDDYDDSGRRAAREDLSPTWPLGLGIDLLVAAGFVVLTVRRLRTPTRKLARGTRVA